MGQGQGVHLSEKLNRLTSLIYTQTEEEMPYYGENNGLFFNSIYIPPEVLALILSNVDGRTLMKSCSRVCRLWNELMKESVWKLKAELKYNRKMKKLPFETYQLMVIKDPFDRNLINNPSGEQKMKHWNIISNEGDQFIVEKPPVSCDEVPDELKKCGLESCFATSFGTCAKLQLVDLVKVGLTGDYMDTFQPSIYVSEWYGSRRDCSCKYKLEVRLLNEQQKTIGKPFIEEISVPQWEGATWHKVEHTFNNYGPGVRYVSFMDEGRDKQFWAGHYGSKMAGATVKVLVEPV